MLFLLLFLHFLTQKLKKYNLTYILAVRHFKKVWVLVTIASFSVCKAQNKLNLAKKNIFAIVSVTQGLLHSRCRKHKFSDSPSEVKVLGSMSLGSGRRRRRIRRHDNFSLVFRLSVQKIIAWLDLWRHLCICISLLDTSCELWLLRSFVTFYFMIVNWRFNGCDCCYQFFSSNLRTSRIFGESFWNELKTKAYLFPQTCWLFYVLIFVLSVFSSNY